MIFESSDNIKIYCKSFCVKKPKASVLLIHGLGEHSRRYGRFLEELNTKSLDVHVMDLRGHGCSEGLYGHVSHFSQYHLDLEYWWKFLCSKGLIRTKLPIFLFGHSLGGLIAFDHAASYRKSLYRSLHGLILSAPAIALQSVMVSVRPILNIGIPSAIGRLHFPNGINPEHLTRDKAIVKAYKEDPLVHSKITPSLFREILNRISLLYSEDVFMELPTLFMVPSADKIVDPDAVVDFVKNLEGVDNELVVFPKFYHEIFNEKNKQEAYKVLFTWVEKCLKQKKSNLSNSSLRKAIGKAPSRLHRARKVLSTLI